MTFGPIPIVISVSGHRDLLEAEVPSISAALKKEFSTLRKQYPNSRILMLNGLAEGADCLTAEIALECGVELVAVLPLPQTEYEKDFSTPATLERFHLLLNRSSQNLKTPFNQEFTDGCSREAHYQALGVYFAEHAQCLYALWDGNALNPLPGGTADVVQQCLDGVTSHNNPLAQPERCQVKHLRCNRKKNSQAYLVGDVGHWEPTKDDSSTEYWQKTFNSIDIFNKAAKKIKNSHTNEITKSIQWLTANKPYPPIIETDLQAYSLADALARIRQVLRQKMLWLISLLVFLSIFFQQLHLGPDMQWHWLALHIALGGVALIGYMLVFNGNNSSEEQYMDWRALAEGLRVQIFWRAAGLQVHASDYYLSSQRDELDWIRHAMRNVSLCTRKSECSFDILWVERRWLKDQKKFFLDGRSSSLQKHKNLFRWKLASRFFVGTGSTTTAALLIGPLLSLSSTTMSWVALVAAVFFLMAAVCRNYASLMAYEEDSNRYKKMGWLFDRALNLLEIHKKTNDIKATQDLLLALGKEALAENGEWLQLHRQRKFEIPT